MNSDKVAVMVPPQFASFMREFFGDKRSVIWPDANILQQSIALDSAFNPREIEIQGDFVYADSDSTGVLYIKFNGTAFPWIPMRPNFSLSGFPIRRAWIKNTSAQAGKTINLYWGYGARIIPPNQDITSIGSITNDVNALIRAFSFGSSYTNVANLAANTNEVILAPASNTAGVDLLDFHNAPSGAATLTGTLLSKASAPASILDGECHGITQIPAGSGVAAARMERARRLAIGRGIYYRNGGTVESGVNRSALYNIL